jgi:hypothetical protein
MDRWTGNDCAEVVLSTVYKRPESIPLKLESQ